MRTRRNAVGAVGILVLAAVALAGVTVSAVGPSESEVAYAIDFRTDVGLQHDEEFVRDTYADPEEYTDWMWGLPLSEAEALDLRDRSVRRQLAQAAVDYAYAEADFGGMWFRPDEQGKAYFRFTGDLEEHDTEIGALMPEGSTFEVLSADRTWASLLELRDAIVAEMDELRAAIPVAQVSPNPRENKVLVGLETADPEAESALQATYGSGVATELIGESQDDSACGGPDPGPYSRSNCRNPLKGGLKIVMEPDPDKYCTSGFLAKKPNGTWLLVTAGHCVTELGTGTDWEHDGNQFGTDHGDSLPPLVGNPYASADFGWIEIDGTEDKSPANEFFRLNKNDIWPILHVGTNASHEVGDLSCRSALSGTPTFVCREIIDTSATKINGKGWNIRNVVRVEHDAAGGDSGAPMVQLRWDLNLNEYQYYLMGAHVHSTEGDYDCEVTGGPCQAWYSKAADFETITGFTICTSSSC